MTSPRLFKWLALTAVVDWLLGRTLTRSAIFMPKTPPVLLAYEGMNVLAQLALTASALLAHAGLLWLSWWLYQRSHRLLPTLLLILTSLNLFSLFQALPVGMTLAYQVIALGAVVELARQAAKASRGWLQGLTWALPAGALAAGKLHQAVASLPGVLPIAGQPQLSNALFSAGEALVVASGLVFGWAFARQVPHRWIWPVASIPPLAFSLLYLAAPAMAGVLSIWSVGLTLYLPWPLYALSLWACTAAMLASVRRGHAAGLAIPLLIAAGYAPQLSTHFALGLIALWLLGLGYGPDSLATTTQPEARSALRRGLQASPRAARQPAASTCPGRRIRL